MARRCGGSSIRYGTPEHFISIQSLMYLSLLRKSAASVSPSFLASHIAHQRSPPPSIVPRPSMVTSLPGRKHITQHGVMWSVPLADVAVPVKLQLQLSTSRCILSSNSIHFVFAACNVFRESSDLQPSQSKWAVLQQASRVLASEVSRMLLCRSHK